MVAPFMVLHIPILFILVMYRMEVMALAMVIHFTGITVLGHVFTVGVGEAITGSDN
jgi:ABC-type branched-subunit amino acid transport system permease subunit